MELALRVGIKDGASGASLKDLRLVLNDAKEKPVGKTSEMAGLLAALSDIVDGGHDAFVRIMPDEQVSLHALRQLFAVLDIVQAGSSVQIEPPPQGQLFYRAFLPDETWRDRAKRLNQPWELRLRIQEGNVSGVFTDVTAKPVHAEGEAAFNAKDAPAPTPTALAKLLDERREDRRELYVLAPPNMSYGSLLAFLRPAISTRETIFLFLDPADAPVPPATRNERK
jgi:hypothetical protein